MFGQLIKWVVTTLFIVVVGVVVGWGIQIVIEEVPLWLLVVVFMIVAIVLFKFAVWCIEHGGW